MNKYEKDFNIEDFTDEVIFTMDPDLVDWETIDEMSEADPDSKEYNKMMDKLHIKRRKNNSRKNKGWYDDYDY